MHDNNTEYIAYRLPCNSGLTAVKVGSPLAENDKHRREGSFTPLFVVPYNPVFQYKFTGLFLSLFVLFQWSVLIEQVDKLSHSKLRLFVTTM